MDVSDQATNKDVLCTLEHKLMTIKIHEASVVARMAADNLLWRYMLTHKIAKTWEHIGGLLIKEMGFLQDYEHITLQLNFVSAKDLNWGDKEAEYLMDCAHDADAIKKPPAEFGRHAIFVAMFVCKPSTFASIQGTLALCFNDRTK